MTTTHISAGNAPIPHHSGSWAHEDEGLGRSYARSDAVHPGGGWGPRQNGRSLLNEVARNVELAKAGLVDRTGDERQRPLTAHQDEYNRGIAGAACGKNWLRKPSLDRAVFVAVDLQGRRCRMSAARAGGV
jgi:hypothetical protein